MWGEETPSALAQIGAALATSGVTTDTYFSLVDQYTKAVVARDGAAQYQLLKRIADGISSMAYENARKQLSFRVRRFAEHPDFSFLRDNLRVEDRAVLTLGGLQRKPEVGMQASSGRKLPIDDATFARQILERQMEPGAKPLERGDPLYERLLGVIDRQVIKWPAIYKIPELDTIWRRIRRGFPVSSARFYTFVSSSYAVGIAKNGYDPHKLTDIKLDGLIDGLKEAWKFERRPDFEKMRGTGEKITDKDFQRGAVFFKLTSTPEGTHISQFTNYGLPNNNEEVVISLEHEMPMLIFLTFLAATPGYAYSGDYEFAIMRNGTALFNKMVQRMTQEVSTRVVVHSFPNTPAARRSVNGSGGKWFGMS
ncbi:MAG: hypothetical protein HY877_08985 [Deltaproteobacteria bacterium]|nr:hypothetical protein [Deltaproteobacteria bacterium]